MIFNRKIKPEDMAKYTALSKSGKSVEALDLFIKQYILVMSSSYSEYVQAQMAKAAELLTKKELGQVEISISSATVALKDAQKSIYNQFIEKIYGDAALSELNITSPAVRSSIKGMTIDTFGKLTEESLAQINTDILQTIRELQRDLVKYANDIEIIDKKADAGKIAGDMIAPMKEKIEKSLWEKNIDFTKMEEDGQLVRYNDGKLVPFDTYNEMATRTTTLNVQREAIAVQEAINGHRVSEYLLIDDRPLKTEPREICEEILAEKFWGVSLIAHDEEAAGALGIYTIDEAKAQGAMGPNCRHGIAPLPDDVLNKIDNILYFAENEIV